MSTAIRSPLLALASPGGALALHAPTLVERLLGEQQTLTAVDRFSRKHEEGDVPAQAKYYRDLIPLEAPKPGQQYAFEVDLDVCTGCKACVAGCHSLNGLDEGEVWRTVGLLHGGTPAAPNQQTVTTSCHHCLDPACMNGCPVKAYEKDPVTGIVRHLDDQCIGCQYCIFMCPYDAPKFSKERGIVRKCDMCSDRLENKEAPACVQSCPNEAIRITVVEQAQVVQAAEASFFLPGAPTPADTMPSTIYKSKREPARNMLPGDFYGVSAEHAHPPLLVMLTVTQLSAGAFFLNWIVGRFFEARAAAAFGVVSACLALALGLAAMGAGTLHLGRPQYSFRAVLGIRTSWLSREALGFLVFSGLASLFAATRLLGVFGMPWLPPALVARLGGWQSGLELGASIAGLVSVFCSVMVYAATKRAHWRGSITGFKFFMTTLILGASTLLMVSGVMSAVRPALAEQFLSRTVFGNLCAVLAAAAGLKILSDASVFLHLGDRHHHVLKRSAIIMSRELRNATQGRFICATLGGVLLPLMVMRLVHGAPQAGWIAGTTVAAFVFALGGELLERFLFFAAAPHSKMPGGLR